MPLFEQEPELLRRFRRGERGALEVVYRFYVNDVLRLLRSGFTLGASGGLVPGLFDISAQMEATQEAFTKAFGESGRNGYDGLRPYRPYLLRIARNVRIDQLRRSGRELLLADPLSDVEPVFVVAQPASNPAEALHSDAQQAFTRSYVAALDAEKQRFVDLRFAEELSQIDVAQRMSITRRRARTLETQVLRGLRRALTQRGLQ